MKLVYSETASQMMEQFSIPYFVYGSGSLEQDFSLKEKEILKDVLPIREELRELFLPYKEKIETYYLLGYGISLFQSIYLALQDEGKTVESVEEVHAYCLTLDEKKIQDYLVQLLKTERESMDETSDFWEYLEQSNVEAQTKWHFSQFYRHPLESMQQLVALSRQLVVLYQPYLEKGASERKSFAASFSLENFLTQTSFLSQYNWNFTEETVLNLYIVSPWIVQFISYQHGAAEKAAHYFFLSCRIDRLLFSKQSLDKDDFSTLLKVMSDSTRYQVLVELIKPHVKSKDIATALDITGAAVSFHTQKLINAQLLLLNRKDKEIKYDVNKPLLKEVVRKLKEDLNLEDEE